MKMKTLVPVFALVVWGCTANQYEKELETLGAGCCGFRVFESAALSDGRIALVAEDEDDIFRAYILSSDLDILTELTVPGEFFSLNLHVDQSDNIHIYNSPVHTFYSWTSSGIPLGTLARSDTAWNKPGDLVNVDSKSYICVSYAGSFLVEFTSDTLLRIGGPYLDIEDLIIDPDPIDLRVGFLLSTYGKLIFAPWYADRTDLQVYNGSGSLLNSVDVASLFDAAAVRINAASIDDNRVLLSIYYNDDLDKPKPKTGVVALSPDGAVKGVWTEADLPGLKKFKKNVPYRVFYNDKLIAFGDISKNNPKKKEVTIPPTP